MNLPTRMLLVTLSCLGLPLSTLAIPQDLMINQKDSPEGKLKKEATGEYLVHEIDTKAFEALERMIKKNKGQANEPDLLMRKAELLIKRTQSAKFFEMQLSPDNEKALSFIPLQIKEQKSKNYLKQANLIYLDIIKRFPKFNLADQALYRLGFNYEQLGEFNLAYNHYQQLILKYTNSSLIPDAYLAIGEILYHQNKFNEANQAYEKVKPFKNSRAYWYAEYKMAWSYFNLKQNETALEQITLVIKSSLKQQDKLTLLQEAIKDSTLFFVEARDPEEAYSFYKNLLSDPELYYPPLIQLGNIYIRYGKLQAYRDLSDQIIKSKNSLKHQNLSLTQRFNFEIEQKNYTQAFDYIQALVKICLDPNECKFHQQANYNLLSKNVWKEHKKSNSKNLHTLLEKILLASYQLEPNPLIADFYFEQKNYQEAANYYYKVFQTHQSEKLLLAAIDSLEQNKESHKALDYQKEFVKKFPSSDQTLYQSMKITLYYLTNKQPLLAKPYLDQITAFKDKLKGDNYHTFADLELDYLNQMGQYKDLVKQAELHANRSDSKTQKEEYLKIKSQSQIKQLVEDIKNEKNILAKEDLIKQLANHLSSSELRANKDQMLDLYLLGISEAFNHNLLMQSWILTQAYLKLANPDKNTLELAKQQLNAALSEGQLDESLTFSLYIATHPLEKDKTAYIKNCLELLKVTGKDKDFIQFAEQHLQPQSHLMHSQLIQNLWTEGHQFSTPAIKEWAERKIKHYKLEPSYSLIEVKKLTPLLDKKQYSEVFNQSKKWYQSHYPTEVRAEARWLQAQVLEKELFEISSKIQNDRIDLVIGIKTERFEKAQKAYQEVMSLSKAWPQRFTEAQLSNERINHHFINFIQTVARHHQRDDLQKLSAALDKELSSQNFQSTSSIFTPPIYTLNLQSLASSSTLFPTIDETLLDSFPEIDLNQVNIMQAQGAYKKSLIAFKEKDYPRSLFLNEIGLTFEKDHPQLLYQRGRTLMAQKKYNEALAIWKPLMGKGLPTQVESTLHFLTGYYEGNCHKSLGFISELPNQKSLKKLSAPFTAFCQAKTQQLEKAYETLEQSSLSKDWLKTYQGAIAEKYESNYKKASAYYQSAQTLSQNSLLKNWIKAKLEWIKTQADPVFSDKRLSEDTNL